MKFKLKLYHHSGSSKFSQSSSTLVNVLAHMRLYTIHIEINNGCQTLLNNRNQNKYQHVTNTTNTYRPTWGCFSSLSSSPLKKCSSTYFNLQCKISCKNCSWYWKAYIYCNSCLAEVFKSSSFIQVIAAYFFLLKSLRGRNLVWEHSSSLATESAEQVLHKRHHDFTTGEPTCRQRQVCFVQLTKTIQI